VKTVNDKVVRHLLAYLSVVKWLVGDIPLNINFALSKPFLGAALQPCWSALSGNSTNTPIFCQRLPTLQRGLSAIADLLVISVQICSSYVPRVGCSHTSAMRVTWNRALLILPDIDVIWTPSMCSSSRTSRKNTGVYYSSIGIRVELRFVDLNETRRLWNDVQRVVQQLLCKYAYIFWQFTNG